MEDVILQWNDVTLEAIKAERTPPPMATRTLAMVHTAMYDSVNAVHQTHKPFLYRKTARAGTSPAAAAAIAAHSTLLSIYPGRRAMFDAALDESLFLIPDGTAKSDGVILGQTVAEEVQASRGKDLQGAKSAYRPQSGLGRWQPTWPKYQPGLLPEWGSLRPFAIPTAADFRLPGPPSLASDYFAKSYKEVMAVGALKSVTRTREQTEIARFWADGEGTVTPPGHWNRIAQSAARDRGNTMAENARLFAMLNVALADAAICCWEGKFEFDYWRPITAIRAANQLANPALTADPNWVPLLTTPPFPSYASGHSTFSSAAAAVLANFFGSDEFRFSTTAEDLPGVTRSFDRFSAAANEAGMSRIYGGIHWAFDNRDGLAAGRKIGDYVSRSFFQPTPATTSRAAPINYAVRIR